LSATVTTYGYLERPYLSDDYLSATETWSYKAQIDRRIDVAHAVRAQIQLLTANFPHPINEQIDRFITTGLHTAREQIELAVIQSHAAREQIKLILVKSHPVPSQVDRKTAGNHAVHDSMRRGTVLMEHCSDGGYLMLPYLTEPYLADVICARVRSQILRSISKLGPRGTQIQKRIDKVGPRRGQVQLRIDKQRHIPAQIDRAQAITYHAQINFALYNTYNLRVLYNFPSRGLTGVNWTASSTASGDFSVLNVNTDIVEQQWRSAPTVTSANLTCDTEVPQGVFLDTLAILNHNLTKSASITLQGSNDAGFATIGVTLALTSALTNIYYIAPTIPTSSYRYWRFIISDSTNTAAQLKIGTIVFGSSIVMQGDSIIDQITRGTTHFSDKVKTEGFTNVSNDRALKYSTGIGLRNLKYNRGNYKNLRLVFDTARTSFKCLWIPVSSTPERFAVFGKLTEIPQETHNSKGDDLDFVAFDITVDEST
jgi:hypothetical protein